MLENVLQSAKYLFKENNIEITLNEALILYLVNEHKERKIIASRFPKDRSYTHRQLFNLESNRLISRVKLGKQVEYELTGKGEMKFRSIETLLKENNVLLKLREYLKPDLLY